MAQNTDPMKIFSARLAALLSSEESNQGFRRALAQELTAFKKQIHDMQPPPSKPGSIDILRLPEVSKIGIWEPKTDNGRVSFVRTPDRRAWWGWADIERIEPKGNKSRVVLLGESVARGAFTDPYFTCATALQTLLQSATGVQDVEVVDIARNGLQLLSLRKLLAPSLALEPDAYVIFAGNNWTFVDFFAALLGDSKIASMLHETPKWELVKTHIEEAIKEQVRSFVKYLGAFSRENQIPVIFIIPEFNLLDWRLESRSRSPLITSDSIKRSLRIKVRAENALADGNLHLAAMLAEEIIQLEEEMNPVGFEILAKCNLIQGKVAEARRLKEKGLETCLATNVHTVPACYSFIQEVLRHESSLHGVTLVDLPRRFEEHLSDTLPGRTYFFDYCHMTPDGIRLAMASTAEKLLPLLGKHGQTWSDLNQLHFDVDPRAIARAYLAAACHNAELGQDYEIVYYLYSESLKRDPEIAGLLRLLIDMHVRRSNIKYVKEAEDIVGRSWLEHYNFLAHIRLSTGYTSEYAPAKILNNRELNMSTIRSLTGILSDYDPEIKQTVGMLLKKEYGIASRGADLLRRPYIDHSWIEKGWQRETIYFRSYGAESSFRLICETPCLIKMSIVCRAPGASSPAEPVRISVNGVDTHSFFAGANWTISNWVIPSKLLQDGINSLMVHWPEQNQSRKERAEEVVKRVDEISVGPSFKSLKGLYTVYGEVSDFRAHVDFIDPCQGKI